jgi:hypothetical protein
MANCRTADPETACTPRMYCFVHALHILTTSARTQDPADEIRILNSLDFIVSFLLDPDGYLNYPPPAPPGGLCSCL